MKNQRTGQRRTGQRYALAAAVVLGIYSASAGVGAEVIPGLPAVATGTSEATGSLAQATAVNNDGLVAGHVLTGGMGTYLAATWDHGTGDQQTIGALPGDVRSVAIDLNDAGQVAGTSNDEHYRNRAFRWSADERFTELGTPPDLTSEARAINASGMIVGTTRPVSNPEPVRAFAWTEAGGMVDLHVDGMTRSAATDVNDHGVVVGTYERDGAMGSFVWTEASGMEELDAPLGFQAQATNNRGDITGLVDGSLWRWTTTGGAERLTGPIPDLTITGMNEHGDIIGWVENSRPIIWTPDAGLADLGVDPDHAARALGINDDRVVVGARSEMGWPTTTESGFWWTGEVTVAPTTSTTVTTVATTTSSTTSPEPPSPPAIPVPVTPDFTG
jgi:probable HAF family extracellular repeat protein